mmetsp:Transcript_21257/g.58942  ORF Transcript_21257/g.58942 Transcript_21257/m.58942 type:complete len:206 (-) Transcript_21257:1299-1916(-)
MTPSFWGLASSQPSPSAWASATTESLKVLERCRHSRRFPPYDLLMLFQLQMQPLSQASPPTTLFLSVHAAEGSSRRISSNLTDIWGLSLRVYVTSVTLDWSARSGMCAASSTGTNFGKISSSSLSMRRPSPAPLAPRRTLETRLYAPRASSRALRLNAGGAACCQLPPSGSACIAGHSLGAGFRSLHQPDRSQQAFHEHLSPKRL